MTDAAGAVGATLLSIAGLWLVGAVLVSADRTQPVRRRVLATALRLRRASR